jgi:hypothetical protein
MNPWIQHVKAYQAKHGCPFREAMKKAKASYKPQKGGARKIAPVLVTAPAKPAKVFSLSDSTTRQQRKEQANEDFFADLERKIANKEGAFGLEENLREYDLGRSDKPEAELKTVRSKIEKRGKARDAAVRKDKKKKKQKKKCKCPKPKAPVCPNNAIKVTAHCRVKSKK